VDDYDVLLEPYRRTVTPEQPLHVDQLPPALRAKCGEVRFFDVRFDEVEALQPFDYDLDDARSWAIYDPNETPAFVCGDGGTVRPVPGLEATFADFVREY